MVAVEPASCTVAVLVAAAAEVAGSVVAPHAVRVAASSRAEAEAMTRVRFMVGLSLVVRLAAGGCGRMAPWRGGRAVGVRVVGCEGVCVRWSGGWSQ